MVQKKAKIVRKFFKTLLIFLFVFTSLSLQNEARAQMDPKLKAFLIVSGYGAGLGALLGVASLAFDAKERAVAQGASLGLYAGIIFGIYILSTYGKPKAPEPGTYQDGITPYQNEDIPPPDDPYSDDAGGSFFDSAAGGFRLEPIDHNKDFAQFEKKSAMDQIPIYLELARFSF